MRKMLLLSTALTLGALNPALAGGPVMVVEEPPTVAEAPASSGGGILPLLLLGAVVAVVIANSSGGDERRTTTISDRRLKRDVVRVGTNKLGLGIYRYRYDGLDGVWEGVMAQEVEILHPGAIRRMPMGYKAVDYARLDLSLRRVA